MTPSLFVSTGAFPSRNLAEILDLAERWGIGAIELSSDVAFAPDNVGLARRHRDRFRFLVHNYFPAPADPFVLNLAASDPGIRERSLRHCREAMELSAELGASLYAAHAGLAIQPRPEDLGRALGDPAKIPRNEAYAIFLDSVGGLLEGARRLGVDFLIENNVVAPFNMKNGIGYSLLLAEPAEILRFAEDVGDGFGILMDVAHLKVTAATVGFDPVTALRDVDGLIRAYHISDNDGRQDNNRPYDQDAWFLPHLRMDLPISLEVCRTDAETVSRCLSLLNHRAGREASI